MWGLTSFKFFWSIPKINVSLRIRRPLRKRLRYCTVFCFHFRFSVFVFCERVTNKTFQYDSFYLESYEYSTESKVVSQQPADFIENHALIVDWNCCNSVLSFSDIVRQRRLRFAGHILRLPENRPAYKAMNWLPDNAKRKPGRPTKTWRATFKEYLQDMGLTWMGAKRSASDRPKWRKLVARQELEELRSKVRTQLFVLMSSTRALWLAFRSYFLIRVSTHSTTNFCKRAYRSTVTGAGRLLDVCRIV